MLTYLLQGLMLGFTAGAQPGPFQTYIISQTMRNGWRRTLIAAFAPLISDAPIILLCLFVLTRVPEWFQHILYMAGGFFILYLAWGAFKLWRNFTVLESAPPEASPKSLFKAATMNVLSPGPYIFWSLVSGPILLRAWQEAPVNGLGFLFGFYFAMIGMNVLVIMLFGIAARTGDLVRRTMIGISALALTGFGLYQLWMGFS
jgi:threonine/homoserine/homoserine lactone efflux protein